MLKRLIATVSTAVKAQASLARLHSACVPHLAQDRVEELPARAHCHASARNVEQHIVREVEHGRDRPHQPQRQAVVAEVPE